MKNLLLLFLFIALVSCIDSEPSVASLESLDGKWVELHARKDTIIFEYNPALSSTPRMQFNSDGEIGGYNGLYSTQFEFYLGDHTISLYNIISSCYCFTDYPLVVSTNRLKVGNFYDPAASGKLETFVKIE